MSDESSVPALPMEAVLGPKVRWDECPAGLLSEATSTLRQYAHTTLANLTIREGRRARLPYYKRHELLDLTVEGIAGIERVFAINSTDTLVWLDGTSGPVHESNEAESLQLSDEHVLDYVRWFLFCVYGDDGPFVLLDAPERIIDDGAGEDRLAEVQAMLVPLALTDPVDGGRFCVKASIGYAGNLFTAHFAVDPSGLMEMLDDEPLAVLEGLRVASYPRLLQPPSDSNLSPVPTPPPSGGVVRPGGLAHDDGEVTRSVVAALLDEAIRARLGHPLLERFNSQSGVGGPTEQLLRFVQGSTPIVVIESEIPFAEDIVAGLIDPSGQTFPPASVLRAEAVSGDDTRCSVAVEHALASLHLISFHAYRSLWDTERTAHQLSMGSATVLIGCERLVDVPEPLRRVADLVLTLPRINAAIFGAIFQRVFKTAPPRGWDSDEDRGEWTRYLFHTDFHAPLRLGLNPLEAVAYLQERCLERLKHVSAEDSPTLAQLHGLGEARQIAEDLIADIAAARTGKVPWSAVDRGLLLVGAPGTGKTTLVKAIARECGVKFIQGSAAQWQSAGYLDAHLRAIRDTFSEARRYAPAILFIDEIDSIGNREDLVGERNSVYQTEVINAVLEQIQGMDEEEPVIVIGATNFADRVDPALRRAGRLDQVVTIPRPNVAALALIFEHYLRSHRSAGTVGADVDEKVLAQLAFGSTGADVEFFVRGAVRRARKEQRSIMQEDLLAEVTRRPRRAENAIRLTPDELRRVSVHEAGHALVSLLSSDGGADITFVSVIPRMDGSLGFVASAPDEGASMTRRQAIEQLEIALGGRAAEELVFGPAEVGLGAGGGRSSDLAAATRIATALVCTSGLGADGRLLWTESPTSEQVEQINAMLIEAYKSARARLEPNRATIDVIVDVLIAEQELDGESLRKIALGDRAPS